MPKIDTITNSQRDFIFLNLDLSGDAKEFDIENMLHRNEFNLVKRQIETRILKAESYQADRKNNQQTKPRSRFHDTITISGPRGSGKTSFLLSLQDTYKRQQSDLSVLDIIDPTLIEEKGHVFLNIISLIKDKVDESFTSELNIEVNSKEFEERRNWDKHIEELALGIPSMDGIGGDLNGNSWQDPEYVMANGLKAVSAARKLEESFNKIIAKGLEIINKKAFLISFDDIDIDFKKGWMVLETIRKYLTSPQLIVLLSGDLKLYSMVIRKHKWENFGTDFLQNEARTKEGLTFFNDKVTEMESQYLQKVLKPEYRFYLGTMFEKVFTQNEIIKIQYEKVDKGDIQSIYNSILEKLGIKNSYQAQAYSSFLLNRPLRTQIRLLSAFIVTGEKTIQTDFINSFLSDLYEKRVDVELARNSPEFLNIIILNLLIREKAINESYQLQPTTADDSLNSSLVALSFLFSIHVSQSPLLIFDYFVRIGYTRNLLGSTGYLDEYKQQSSGLSQHPNFENLCKHAGLFQNKVLRDITGLMNAYAGAAVINDTVRLPGGIIQIYSTAAQSKLNRIESSYRIDWVFRSQNMARNIAYFPFGISKYPNTQQSMSVYSIYTLLGTIGELIRKIENDDLDYGIEELSEQRTYPMPDFGRVNNTTYSERDIENDDENYRARVEAYKHSDREFKNLISEWCQLYPRKELSPHLLGKISTRMFYAFDKIQEKERPNKLGAAMHIRIVAFLNAVLIEDIRENLVFSSSFNINNTILKEKIFIDNLKAVLRDENEFTKHAISNLSFSKWMLSCPLFLTYLDPNIDQLESLLYEFCERNLVKQAFQNSIFHSLQDVSVKETSRGI